MAAETKRLAPKDGLGGRWRLARLTLVVCLGFAAFAGYAWLREKAPRSYRLRIAAGSLSGQRAGLAHELAAEAANRSITLDLVESRGSVESLELVERGGVEIALVQGGLARQRESGEAKPYRHVRQIATLQPEPLHCVARPELISGGIATLRGKRLNLSAQGSGTRKLALEVLNFAGLAPADYIDEDAGYSDLLAAPTDELPDAVFVVSPLPSGVVSTLVQKHGYRLKPLPFAEALAIRDRTVVACTLPPYSYRVDPPEPAEPVSTVANLMAVVARDTVQPEAVMRLMESMFDGEFERSAQLEHLDAKLATKQSEFPLHPGTQTYLRRNSPLFTGELIESAENARSFLVSGAIAAFLAYRWYRRRRAAGFEVYLDRVSQIEVDTLTRANRGPLERADLIEAERRLTAAKSEALEAFSSGALSSDEHLGSFLTHVADVRRMIQHLSDRTSHEKSADRGQAAGAKR